MASWWGALGLVFAVLVQLGALAYAAGRITARLEALERSVAGLLDWQRRHLPIPALLLVLVALGGCAGGREAPELRGHYVPDFALPDDATPREVLGQACVSDWCPLLRPSIAAELGCPDKEPPRPFRLPPVSAIARH